MRKIVLASASPRRSGLLKRLGLDFDIMVPDLEENLDTNLDPTSLARKLAIEKCSFVMDRLSESKAALSPLLVIAADTVVFGRERVMGKPADSEDAFRMLKMLQGTWHDVYTGVCIGSLPERRTNAGVERTRVSMRALDDSAIHAYISTGEPYGKAGGYGIQGYGSLIVERIEGCYFNVVGLPVPMLFKILEDEYGLGLFSWLQHSSIDGGEDGN